MDIYRAIRELQQEKKSLDLVIGHLESLLVVQATNKAEAAKRRGRKSMSVEERRAVSTRMRKYWEEQRAGKK